MTDSHETRGGAGRGQRRGVAGMGEKREIAGAGLVERNDASDSQSGVGALGRMGAGERDDVAKREVTRCTKESRFVGHSRIAVLVRGNQALIKVEPQRPSAKPDVLLLIPRMARLTLRLSPLTRSEAGTAGEAEALCHVVRRLRGHDSIVEADRSKRRLPQDRGADGGADLVLVFQDDAAPLAEVGR